MALPLRTRSLRLSLTSRSLHMDAETAPAQDNLASLILAGVSAAMAWWVSAVVQEGGCEPYVDAPILQRVSAPKLN